EATALIEMKQGTADVEGRQLLVECPCAQGIHIRGSAACRPVVGLGDERAARLLGGRHQPVFGERAKEGVAATLEAVAPARCGASQASPDRKRRARFWLASIGEDTNTRIDDASGFTFSVKSEDRPADGIGSDVE